MISLLIGLLLAAQQPSPAPSPVPDPDNPPSVSAIVVACKSANEMVEVRKAIKKDFDDLMAKVKSDRKLALCIVSGNAWSLPSIMSVATDDGGIAIAISEIVVLQMSPNALRAVVAHEIGHQLGDKEGMTDEESEIAADAFSANLVGPEDVQLAMIEFGDLFEGVAFKATIIMRRDMMARREKIINSKKN